MHLEIFVGSDSPTSYPLDRHRILIGSDLSCDIILSSAEVSRKHLLIIVDKDEYYAIDQGSTNGSYLNDEKLIPGKRIELTTYFPIRLGASVLVSLINDAEDEKLDKEMKLITPNMDTIQELPEEGPRQSEATTIMSLKDLKNANTKNLVKKREEVRKKVQAKKEKRKNSTAGTNIALVCLLGGLAYYSYVKKMKSDEEAEIERAKVAEVAARKIEEEKIKAKTYSVTTGQASLYENLLSQKKCTTDFEKALCQGIPSITGDPWGAFGKENLLEIAIDANSYYEAAKALLFPGPEAKVSDQARARKSTEKDIWEVAVAVFLIDGITGDIDYRKLVHHKGRFVFYLGEDLRKRPVATMSIDIPRIEGLKVLMNRKRLSFVPESGVIPIHFGLEYYQLSTLE